MHSPVSLMCRSDLVISREYAVPILLFKPANNLVTIYTFVFIFQFVYISSCSNGQSYIGEVYILSASLCPRLHRENHKFLF